MQLIDDAKLGRKRVEGADALHRDPSSRGGRVLSSRIRAPQAQRRPTVAPHPRAPMRRLRKSRRGIRGQAIHPSQTRTTAIRTAAGKRTRGPASPSFIERRGPRRTRAPVLAMAGDVAGGQRHRPHPRHARKPSRFANSAASKRHTERPAPMAARQHPGSTLERHRKSAPLFGGDTLLRTRTRGSARNTAPTPSHGRRRRASRQATTRRSRLQQSNPLRLRSRLPPFRPYGCEPPCRWC